MNDDCMTMEHDRARRGARRRPAGDVPVGAVIVIGEAIIGRGRNRREVDRDPTAHAEVDRAARRRATRSGTWRVEGTLYVTHEPCPMCAGALVNARSRGSCTDAPTPRPARSSTLYQIVDRPAAQSSRRGRRRGARRRVRRELAAFFASSEGRASANAFADDRSSLRPISFGEVSEWPMVSDSKSGVRKGTGGSNPSLSASSMPPDSWRGDRVAEGARLEIVCTERYRGFESLSLRTARSAPATLTRSFYGPG